MSIDLTTSLLATARAAWPGVEIAPGIFSRYLGERLGDDHQSEVHAADLYLACACLEREPRALAALEARYVSQVPAFIARVGRSPAFVAEVTQKVRERILVGVGESRPKLAEYSGRGPLGSWLRVVAIRVALNLREAEKPPLPYDQDSSEDLLRGPRLDPELDYIRTRYSAEFRQCFVDALAGLEERGRALLRLHVVNGLAVGKIAHLYGVHRATAQRWIGEARDALAEDTRARLQERLRLSGGELDSLLVLVRSQLNLSLRRVLGKDDAPGSGR
jgi:RNA polymerase sigma-70 factor (ECF subfamily)